MAEFYNGEISLAFDIYGLRLTAGDEQYIPSRLVGGTLFTEAELTQSIRATSEDETPCLRNIICSFSCYMRLVDYYVTKACRDFHEKGA